MSKTTPPKAKKKSSVSTAQAVNDEPLPAPFSNALPSQLELATLAAAIDSPNKTPNATAARALDLWQACGGILMKEILEREYLRDELKKVKMFGLDQKPIKDFPESQLIFNRKKVIGAKIEMVPLERFLKPHFAKNSKQAHMIKKYRDFQRERITEFFWDMEDPLTDEALLDRVAKEIEKHRTKGIRIFEATRLSDDFSEFLERQKAEIKVERARKGGIARREKAEKSPQKTPQRKKPLAVKSPAPSKRKPSASSKADARGIAGE